MCAGRNSVQKVETQRDANLEMAISHIASVFGIAKNDVTNDLKLGPCVHYVVNLINFSTGAKVEVKDLGTATAGDIFNQL